ncbi:C4-dicarboxylate ABC transporter permease [Clostridia bacterium]|nr:C4-dicarboxylate ABC transporter permease [Clostridia bacterium]
MVIRQIMKGIDSCNRFLFWVVGISIIFATFLVFLDVILRYLFRTVTTFGYDLSIWMTAVIALIGGGYITLIREHIRVDIIYLKLSEKGQNIINLIVYMMILFLAVIMIGYGFERVAFYFDKGSVAMSGFNIYIWIKWLIVPISGIFLGMQAASEFIKDSYFLKTGQKMILDPVKSIGTGNDADEQERGRNDEWM